MRRKMISCLAVFLMLLGCDKAAEIPTKDVILLRRKMTAAFLDECKKVAVRDGYACEGFWRYDAKLAIIYVDDKYLSFREKVWVDAEMYAHGGTSYTIGTIDRKTGQILKAADLIPEQRIEEIKKAIRDGIAKEIGEENLLNTPEVIDNCCLVEGGLFLVYNEYEIAPFMFGPIEVVVQILTDESLPVVVNVKANSIYSKED